MSENPFLSFSFQIPGAKFHPGIHLTKLFVLEHDKHKGDKAIYLSGLGIGVMTHRILHS